MQASSRSQTGRFKITEKIGRGGQGTVYRAEDRALNRVVAIKLISSDGIGSGASALGFPAEARIAARLQHPNIIPIFDVGAYKRRPYLVFEFVDGRTFRDMITGDGAMPPRRALALFRPVLEGMAHAHERDVLHLDLTPGNVLVSERDVPRIMDFGLSQMMNSVPDSTTVPMGTLRYMAPEQLEERPPTPQTDVRALGLILYEMLTGEPAIKGTSIAAVARAICMGEIDLGALHSLPEGAPIVEFLSGALARDPQRRYPNATAMLNAFDRAVQAREEARQAAHSEPSGATVEFLLRRMQRREDFPALSRSLMEINRMTSSESNATAQQLADVVLRDYALTNKLLKLANSAYYGRLAGEVKSVSHAISLIGFEQLRMTANCLTLLSHITDRSQSSALQDLLLRSLFTALLARQLADQASVRNAEEAFICGMLQTLGEILVQFYFSTEHEDILEVMQEDSCAEPVAARRVLGIDYAALGTAVAGHWRFPDEILIAIAGLPDDGPVPAPENAAQRLRDVAVLADRISHTLADESDDVATGMLPALCGTFAASIPAETSDLVAAALSAMGRLDEYASILALPVAASAWASRAKSCLSELRSAGCDKAAPPCTPE